MRRNFRPGPGRKIIMKRDLFFIFEIAIAVVTASNAGQRDEEIDRRGLPLQVARVYRAVLDVTISGT
jgi:hypothetical protein